MRNTFETEFEIGDRIFYATPDGEAGIVLDVTYSIRSKRVQYLVTFGRQAADEVWADAIELSHAKVF